LHTRGQVLVEQLWEGLHRVPGVRLFGPSPEHPRTPTIGFAVTGRSSEAIATELAELGVFVSHGDFYATTVVERLGQAAQGLVRAGCACYTTSDDVARLLDGVRHLGRQ